MEGTTLVDRWGAEGGHRGKEGQRRRGSLPAEGMAQLSKQQIAFCFLWDVCSGFLAEVLPQGAEGLEAFSVHRTCGHSEHWCLLSEGHPR